MSQSPELRGSSYTPCGPNLVSWRKAPYRPIFVYQLFNNLHHAAFFRKYKGLPEDMRRKIRMIVNVLQ